jgi:hypothetical protein
LENLSTGYREYENELLKIKFKQEVIVSPLRQYIKEWLEGDLINITEGLRKSVDTDHIIATNKDIKSSSESK